MKYIRTKDGIFDKIDETMMLASLPPQYELTKNGVHIGYEQCKNCILADTIEELCDVYVVEDDYAFAIFNNFKLARQTKGTCYGAIRTEWGLKYVAKMNSNGELELL